jgi:predicted DNA-binding transcriptional regulator AlpA
MISKPNHHAAEKDSDQSFAVKMPLAEVTRAAVGRDVYLLRRMLGEKEVLKLLGIGHTSLWRMVKRGQFPKPTFMSPNRCFWFEDQVLAWQNQIEGQGRSATSL